MEFQHELIIPNEGLPFKVFLFEGGNGNYVREKHWYAFARSVAQVNLNTPDKIMKHYEDTIYDTKYIKDLLKHFQHLKILKSIY